MEIVGFRVKRGFLRFPFYCVKCIPAVASEMRRSRIAGRGSAGKWPLAVAIVRDDSGEVRHVGVKGNDWEDGDNRWADWSSRPSSDGLDASSSQRPRALRRMRREASRR